LATVAPIAPGAPPLVSELASPPVPPPAPVRQVAQPAPVSPPAADPTPTVPLAVAATVLALPPYQAPAALAESQDVPFPTPPPVESAPREVRPADVHAEVPVRSEPPAKKRGSSSVVLAVIGLAALGLGVAGGAYFLQRSSAKTASREPQATAVPAPEPTTPPNLEPTAVPPPVAEPAPSGDAPAVASSAPAAPEPAPSASAAPAEPAAPIPPPSVPPPSFDLAKLPGDRGALLVHSSAAARVFVHGRDYGETNQYLLTSCGIRFVRLGRGLNTFIEPGRSVVVRCGRVTELSIEPDR
jgi:hypothetical protein